jgi:hypothetical protein
LEGGEHLGRGGPSTAITGDEVKGWKQLITPEADVELRSVTFGAQEGEVGTMRFGELPAFGQVEGEGGDFEGMGGKDEGEGGEGPGVTDQGQEFVLGEVKVGLGFGGAGESGSEAGVRQVLVQNGEGAGFNAALDRAEKFPAEVDQFGLNLDEGQGVGQFVEGMSDAIGDFENAVLQGEVGAGGEESLGANGQAVGVDPEIPEQRLADGAGELDGVSVEIDGIADSIAVGVLAGEGVIHAAGKESGDGGAGDFGIGGVDGITAEVGGVVATAVGEALPAGFRQEDGVVGGKGGIDIVLGDVGVESFDLEFAVTAESQFPTVHQGQGG